MAKTECGICMDVQQLLVLPCNHKICHQCLIRHSIFSYETQRPNVECPYCRQSLVEFQQQTQNNNPSNSFVIQFQSIQDLVQQDAVDTSYEGESHPLACCLHVAFLTMLIIVMYIVLYAIRY